MKDRRCIVIFDGEKNATKDLAETLPSSDYKILYCSRLQDVYEALPENMIDIFFLDIATLEESSGDILSELDIRCKQGLKILTYSDETVKSRSLAESDNVFALIAKPFDRLQVKKIIQSALRVRDLTRALESAQSHLAKDGETGLYGESYLYERVNAEYKRAQRYFYPLALSVFEICVQKGNQTDTLNRAESLKVSNYFKHLIRDNDVLVQNNAGHYYLLLPDTRKKGAEVLTMRVVSGIQRELSSKVFSDGREFKVYAGFVSYPEDGTKEDTAFLQLAQHALAQAKRERTHGSIFSFRGMDVTGIAPIKVLY